MSTRPPRLLSLFVCALASFARAEEPASTPARATAFNQRVVSNKACGPAALLNAFRFGDARWRRGLDAAPGKSDRERLSFTIRTYGMRPSSQFAGRPRWSNDGVNLADLTDLANDMAASRSLPPLKSEVLVPLNGTSRPKLLALAHKRCATSLANGFPPVLGLRRFVWRKTQGGQAGWLAVDAHYITLTQLPVLGWNARNFQIGYLDPNGGRGCVANVHLVETPAPSGLVIDCPGTPVGRHQVRNGESTVVMLSSVLGRW
ncbi:MAG TPA: hypothetical protein VIM57_01365 [Luteolibacter sp.]